MALYPNYIKLVFAAAKYAEVSGWEDTNVIHASLLDVCECGTFAQRLSRWTRNPQRRVLQDSVSLPVPLRPGGFEWQVTFVPVCGEPLQLHTCSSFHSDTHTYSTHACLATAHLQWCAKRRCCYPEHNLSELGGVEGVDCVLSKHIQTRCQ